MFAFRLELTRKTPVGLACRARPQTFQKPQLSSLESLLLVLLALICLPSASWALGPNDVFIVANKTMPESKEVARHYCQKRGVPEENIVELDLPTGENISRNEFNTRLREPLRQALEKRKDQVKVLLTVYGVPLRVGRSEPSDKEKQKLKEWQDKVAEAQTKKKKVQAEIQTLQEQIKKKSTKDLQKKLKDLQNKQKQLDTLIRIGKQSQRTLNHSDTVASVDSELMLLWWDNYNLHRWQGNLLNFQLPEKARQKRPPILMVSRLDGPTSAIAKRLVDDAVEVEKTGLKGKVYVDARGIGYNKKKPGGSTGYGGYDESLREMAQLLKKAKMTVILDNKSALFASQSCPDAALYCGWYSLARYVDCCQFTKGAVAYHIASAEAVSLRNPQARYWCPNLLKNGVAATIGPVSEPYTIGFPKPAEFFGFLVTGEYTLVECYSKTLLLNSWMTVLVGDPLYNPYKQTPLLQPDQIKPSPEGSRLFLR